MTKCRKCRRSFALRDLDAKPEMTIGLRNFEHEHGQAAMLVHAADLGKDFTRLECRDCYGPEFARGAM